MNKKINKLIALILITITCIPGVTHAAKCEEISRDLIVPYEQQKKEYEKLECSTREYKTEEDITNYYVRCENLANSLDSIETKLFDLYNQDIGCDDIISKSFNINNCGPVTQDLKYLANQIFNYFYIIAPFLLIIFGSIDLFKIVVMSSPETIKKSKSNFFKRVIAFLLLYFSTSVVKIITSFSPTRLSGDVYVCNSNHRTVALNEISSILGQLGEEKNISETNTLFNADVSKTKKINNYDAADAAKLVEQRFETAYNTAYEECVQWGDAVDVETCDKPSAKIANELYEKSEEMKELAKEFSNELSKKESEYYDSYLKTATNPVSYDEYRASNEDRLEELYDQISNLEVAGRIKTN